MHFGPWLAAALVALMLYLRLRRQFGRQLVKPVRMGVRMALLVVLAAALAPLALSSARGALIALGALGTGVALGAWAAAHTRLEQADRRVYYVPHAYAGMLVSALVIVRIGFRLFQPAAGGMATGGSRADLASSVANPVTLGLLFVLVGYYLTYTGWVLWSARALGTNASAASSPQG